MVCEAGTTPARMINTKSKHYTVVSLTTLSREPVMCCVIFAGVKEIALCETGLDLSKEIISCTDDIDLTIITQVRKKYFQVDQEKISEGRTYLVFVDVVKKSPSLPKSCETYWSLWMH